MKHFCVTVEHRSFNLNIQDEYYDKVVGLFKEDNNTIADMLSICIEGAIEMEDLDIQISECILNIENKSENKINENE